MRSGAAASTAGAPRAAGTQPLEDLEIRAAPGGVYGRYGYDFRDYAHASLRRRVRHCVREEGLRTRLRACRSGSCTTRRPCTASCAALSVSVTSMFRDPGVLPGLPRARCCPSCAPIPLVRIWHAGCATGEEVYSLAILLQEEGLYDRSRIYATDMNEAAAAPGATTGAVPLRAMRREHGQLPRRRGGPRRLRALLHA